MRASLLVVSLAVTGCFAEAPSAVGNDCPIGSKGCPCTGGGACDAPLECHAQSQACYDPDCDEGSLSCPCFQGMCFGDLMCTEGFCHDPIQASGSGTAGETTATDVGNASSTSVVSTGVATTGIADTGFDEDACLACFAANLGVECTQENETCSGGSGCTATRECIGTQLSAFAMCCEVVLDGVTNWNALATCLAGDVCLEPCAGTKTTCE